MPGPFANTNWNQNENSVVGFRTEIYRIICGCVAIVAVLLLSRGYVVFWTTSDYTGTISTAMAAATTSEAGQFINALTWNIAAINNNPFQFRITSKDDRYNVLMQRIGSLVQEAQSGNNAVDMPVHAIFTDAMFEQLLLKLRSSTGERSDSNTGGTGGVSNSSSSSRSGFDDVNNIKGFWLRQLRERKIITGFLLDDELGRKRLVSMPDRVTNTINLSNGSELYRPAVINCYNSGDIGSLQQWWQQWLHFFFEQEADVRKRNIITRTIMYHMIPVISRAKYPAVTEEEEAVSRPLQLLYLAIFDAILVHLMSTASNCSSSGTSSSGSGGRIDWQPLRGDMCQLLHHKKNERTVEILAQQYAATDVHFLQEVAGDFQSFAANKKVAQLFDIYGAATMDAERDQNSFILLKKGAFRDVIEVTDDVLAFYSHQTNQMQSLQQLQQEQSPGKQQQQQQQHQSALRLPVVNGDLLVLSAVSQLVGCQYILASFHGDASGLATESVVKAVAAFSRQQLQQQQLKQCGTKLLFGLDANTYSDPDANQYGVVEFGALLRSLRLSSCFGRFPNPQQLTTNNEYTAITVPPRSRGVSEDKNPKDFIIFAENDFVVLDSRRDNTGSGTFEDAILYPTDSFPSDHSIVYSRLITRDRTRGSTD